MNFNSWTGKSFLDWFDEHEGDTRKVHFCIRWNENGSGRITHFTTDDIVDSMWAFKLMKCTIHSLELKKNEWWINLGLAS